MPAVSEGELAVGQREETCVLTEMLTRCQFLYPVESVTCSVALVRWGRSSLK
jgi:hypothetical protein